MIGGTVIEVIQLPDRIWVNCIGKRGERTECAIYVERNAKSRCIGEGDAVWWQGGFAMWTPAFNRTKSSSGKLRCGKDYDIRIPRIGYSGVKRPK